MLDLDLSSLFGDAAQAGGSPTVEVLTVCTGNICRSPLAEQLLRARLTPLDVSVSSAGTHAAASQPMPDDAARLAADLGVAADEIAGHRARWLTEAHLAHPDLVLAMSREHRTHVVGLAPARIRSVFTVREFARLSAGVPDTALKDVADAAGDDPHARVRATLALLSSRRGDVDAPADASVDDVVDPYRRSWSVYEQSAEQLVPAIDEVARVLRAVLGGAAQASGSTAGGARLRSDRRTPEAGSTRA